MRKLVRLLPGGFRDISRIFWRNVREGYRVYESYVLAYGRDVKIVFCAAKGTGDYYITGRYLRRWLEKENIKNWIFLTFGRAETNVTGLFPIYRGHTIEEPGVICDNLRAFACFAGLGRKSVVNLHHQVPQPFNWMWNITNSHIMGYRGLHMVDFYLYSGFGLSSDTTADSPVFEKDRDKIKRIFTEHGLQEGKTVMLSPYSTGLEQFQIPDSFWEKIARICAAMGWSVCTNCAGEETPVAGTLPLCVGYAEIVPFLDRAGMFIGIRSGLCDIVATSRCRKIILHTYRAKWWPDGKSIAYTGLNHMGLCDDAIELETGADNDWETLYRQTSAAIHENPRD